MTMSLMGISEPLLAFTRVELLRMHGRGLHSEKKLLKINK